jgi:hypothetical protein
MNGTEGINGRLFYEDTSLSFTSSTQLITKGYADALSLSGTPTSTEFNGGQSQLPTAAQVAAGTASSSAGMPLVVPVRLVTSTPTSGIGAGYLPATGSNSKISDSFTDFTTNKTYTGTATFNATTTFTGRINASSTNSTPNLVVDGFTAASSTVSSTIYGTLNVDRIGPVTGNTTTLSKNISVGGDVTWSGKSYGKSSFSSGQFSKAINNTSDITISHGLGVIPTLITMECMHANGNGLTVSNGSYTASGQSSSYGNYASGAQAQGQSGSNIITMVDGAANTLLTANVSSVTASTITLTVGSNANSGNARLCQWTAQL